MTTKITCVLAFLPGFLWAQIQWEHTYNSSNLERRMLDQSGEIYLQAKTCALELSQKDHSPWKSVPLLLPDGDACAHYLLSERYTDNDPGLEVIFSWALVDHHPKDGRVFQDDNGQISPLTNGSPLASFSMPPGLAPKLLSGSTVYSLPGPVVEHDYGHGNAVCRIPLADGGDRYLVYDRKIDETQFTGFHFYDGAHQWVKTVHLSPGLDFVSQRTFNSDELFEFAGEVYVSNTDPNPNRLMVVQEDGTVLHNIPCTSARLDRIPSLPDRYFVTHLTPEGDRLTQVIQLLPWTVLEAFENKYVTRHALNGEEELFLVQPKSGDSLMQIYDSTFSLIRAFTMPAAYRHYWNLFFTRNKFSATGLLELCFTNNRQGTRYVTCIDETGALLYDFPQAIQARFDRQAGMEDRLFVQYPDSTAVYRFDFSSGTANIPIPEIQLLPNPAKIGQPITVRWPLGQLPVDRVKLFTSTGQFVQSWPVNLQTGLLQLDLAGLPVRPGVYFLQLFGPSDMPLSVLKCVLTD